MIVFNGKQYASVNDMPPEERAAYTQYVQQVFKGMQGMLADANQDGIPDIFQQGNAQAMLQNIQMTIPSGQVVTITPATGTVGAVSGMSPPSDFTRAPDGDNLPKYKCTTSTGRRVGGFVVQILLFCAIYVGALIAWTNSTPNTLRRWWPDQTPAFYDTLHGVIFGAIMGAFFIGLAFLLWRYAQTPQAWRELREQGEQAEAMVIKAWETGTRINRQPLIGVLLEVHPLGRPAYRVETSWMVSFLSIGRVYPGVVVKVRIDPQDPRKLVPEAD